MDKRFSYKRYAHRFERIYLETFKIPTFELGYDEKFAELTEEQEKILEGTKVNIDFDKNQYYYFNFQIDMLNRTKQNYLCVHEKIYKKTDTLRLKIPALKENWIKTNYDVKYDISTHTIFSEKFVFNNKLKLY